MELYNDDCFNIFPYINDNSVDLIFCDLPYGATDLGWDVHLDIDKLWDELRRIRKVNGIVIFTTTTKYGFSIIRSNPCEFKLDCVWYKTKKSGFLTSHYRPLVSHEMLYYFWDKKPKYNVDKFHKKIEKKNNNKKKIINSIYGNVIGTGNMKGGPNYDPPLPTSVISVKSVKATPHRTSKPLELMEFLLKYWTDEGDLVLDVCMGGGSMGIACKSMKRNYIGIEIEEDMFNIAEMCINQS